MELDWIIQQINIARYWLSTNVPYPWLAFLHSAVALYLGYLFGQFSLAERIKHSGYDVHVWTDEQGQRRYTVTENGRVVMGENEGHAGW